MGLGYRHHPNLRVVLLLHLILLSVLSGFLRRLRLISLLRSLHNRWRNAIGAEFVQECRESRRREQQLCKIGESRVLSPKSLAFDPEAFSFGSFDSNFSFKLTNVFYEKLASPAA